MTNNIAVNIAIILGGAVITCGMMAGRYVPVSTGLPMPNLKSRLCQYAGCILFILQLFLLTSRRDRRHVTWMLMAEGLTAYLSYWLIAWWRFRNAR